MKEGNQGWETFAKFQLIKLLWITELNLSLGSLHVIMRYGLQCTEQSPQGIKTTRGNPADIRTSDKAEGQMKSSRSLGLKGPISTIVKETQ